MLTGRMEIPDERVRLLSGSTADLTALTAGKHSLLYFLRDSACTLCMHAVSNILEFVPLLAKQGIQLILCVSSTVQAAQKNLGPIPGIFVICDETGALYRDFGVFPAPNQTAMEGPCTLQAIAQARTAGFVHGIDSGNPLQLPAVFLIGPDCTVRNSYYGKTAEDTPLPGDCLRRFSYQSPIL